MKAQPILICIPDISGFTKFMANVDFELSGKVVPSLLNNIVYSNDIDLKISEIEGDAVLFYRQGPLPGLLKLIDQCKFFYKQFYSHLNELREKNKDSKNADMIPQMLGLKIVLHFGENVASVSVGKHIKLLGADVIAAHRLLKNDIPMDEYILISKELAERYESNLEELVDWAEIGEGSVSDDDIGEIPYYYIPLTPLEESENH